MTGNKETLKAYMNFLKIDVQEVIDKHLRRSDFSFDAFFNEVWSRLPEELHPLDGMEAFSEMVYCLAKVRPEVLIRALDDETLQPDPMGIYIVEALRHAKRTDEVFDAVSRAADHKNVEFRFAATRTLVKFKSEKTWPKLLEKLKDRSDRISGYVWEKIKNPDFYDFPYGIKQLRAGAESDEYKKFNYKDWLKEYEILQILESRPHNAKLQRRKPKAQTNTTGDPLCSSPSKKS